MNATDQRPNGDAPTTSPGANRGGTFRMGAKGGRTAQAWQWIWDQLSTTDWTYGDTLADRASQQFDLGKLTVVELLARMRKAGHLEQKMIPVQTFYARGEKGFTAARPRAHYRIAGPAVVGRLVPPAEEGGRYRWEEK